MQTVLIDIKEVPGKNVMFELNKKFKTIRNKGLKVVVIPREKTYDWITTQFNSYEVGFVMFRHQIIRFETKSLLHYKDIIYSVRAMENKIESADYAISDNISEVKNGYWVQSAMTVKIVNNKIVK